MSSSLAKRPLSKFQSCGNPQPQKRYRTETEEIALSSSAPPSRRTGEFLLQLVCEETITSRCTKEIFEKGKNLISEVSHLLVCNTQRSKLHPIIRLSGVVSNYFNVSIILQDENTENINTSIAKVFIYESKCTCEFIPIQKQICEHIVGVLAKIFYNGSRCVEFHQNLSTKIGNFSQEILAKCITDLITERPEVIPVVKSLLEPNDYNKKPKYMYKNKVISSGNRKARVLPSNVIQEIEIDPNVISQSIREGFNKFMCDILQLCTQSCNCECHQEMCDDKTCNCKDGFGNISLFESPIKTCICTIDDYLKHNSPSSSSNALVAIEAVTKEFFSLVLQMQGKKNSEKKFASHCYEIISKYYMNNLINFGKELCWRFALIMVRREIYFDVRSLVGNSMTSWILFSPDELKSYITQIHSAAFDDSMGVEDCFISNPIITAARAFEFHRILDIDSLKEYWVNSKLPFTPERFLQLNIGFHELVQ